MFEKFTDRARRVVVLLSQEEARALDHNYIGTEHILLGLLSEREGVAARALESLGVSLDEVRRQVEEIIGRGKQAGLKGHIPFTPRAKTVFQLANADADYEIDLDDDDQQTRQTIENYRDAATVWCKRASALQEKYDSLLSEHEALKNAHAEQVAALEKIAKRLDRIMHRYRL